MMTNRFDASFNETVVLDLACVEHRLMRYGLSLICETVKAMVVGEWAN